LGGGASIPDDAPYAIDREHCSTLNKSIERWAAQRTRALGPRPEFPFARLQAWARSNSNAILVERRKIAPFGVYTLVCFERTVASLAA